MLQFIFFPYNNFRSSYPISSSFPLYYHCCCKSHDKYCAQRLLPASISPFAKQQCYFTLSSKKKKLNEIDNQRKKQLRKKNFHTLPKKFWLLKTQNFFSANIPPILSFLSQFPPASNSLVVNHAIAKNTKFKI